MLKEGDKVEVVMIDGGSVLHTTTVAKVHAPDDVVVFAPHTIRFRLDGSMVSEDGRDPHLFLRKV